jgi:hypothetical protein
MKMDRGRGVGQRWNVGGPIGSLTVDSQQRGSLILLDQGAFWVVSGGGGSRTRVHEWVVKSLYVRRSLRRFVLGWPVNSRSQN